MLGLREQRCGAASGCTKESWGHTVHLGRFCLPSLGWEGHSCSFGYSRRHRRPAWEKSAGPFRPLLCLWVAAPSALWNSPSSPSPAPSCRGRWVPPNPSCHRGEPKLSAQMKAVSAECLGPPLDVSTKNITKSLASLVEIKEDGVGFSVETPTTETRSRGPSACPPEGALCKGDRVVGGGGWGPALGGGVRASLGPVFQPRQSRGAGRRPPLTRRKSYDRGQRQVRTPLTLQQVQSPHTLSSAPPPPWSLPLPAAAPGNNLRGA